MRSTLKGINASIVKKNNLFIGPIIIFLLILFTFGCSLFDWVELKDPDNDDDDDDLILAPDLNVKQGSNDIPSGTQGYDFGDIQVDLSSDAIEFIIENTGTANLIISENIIMDNTTDFSITQPSSLIEPGNNTTFTIIFSPTSTGSKTAIVTINNNDLDESTYTFNVDGFCFGTGALTYGGRYDFSNEGEGARSVAVSPDGKHVYVINIDIGISLYAVEWFTRNTSTGALTYGNRYSSTNIEGARSVVVSPDGNHVYVTADLDDAVAWFTRNISTGALTYEGIYSNANIDWAYSVTISPDGNHVYVTATGDDVVAWFTRDTSTGELTYVDRYSNTNIDNPRSVTVSPDGNHVYVAAAGADAVAWFTRDADASGDLTYGGEYSDSKIDEANSVIVSPDGNHVYITARNADAVAWFTRDADASGDLTYGGEYSDSKIDEANSVTISPDGNHIYVTARNADAVAWFSRNISTGELTYEGRYSNTNIAKANFVAISPEGDHLYVTASYVITSLNAVAWFTRDK